MRISSLQLFRQGINAILDQQTRLAETQNQLSTGKRIVSPADDPTGAAQLVGLSETARLTEQYQRNGEQARVRLELEDLTLSAVGDSLQRVRELAVRGLNDTNGAEERTAIAQEVRQLLDEMIGLANRKDGTGNYMFAGFQVNTEPFTDNGAGTFVYAGDSGQRQIQIASGRQVRDGDSGQAVFLDIPRTSGGTENVFTTLYTLATDLEANAPNGNSLNQLDNAINHVLEIRATVGARLNAVDSQNAINESFLLQLEQTRSAIEDLDYAEAASRLSRESITLQAAQQAFVKVQNLNLFNFL
ncbi:MAG: flagellar hook-associated protein FlgL [Thiogranum sp.]|nr:flagellar hook-associated protein FlgL [Thiogranum sp.]